jgi:SAM-dependent methyltransferase
VLLTDHSPQRVRLVSTLRFFGLLGAADFVRRAATTRQSAADNAAFLNENKGFVAPPLDFVYEVTGRSSLRTFAQSGRMACEGLATIAEAHLDRPLARVLDWGAGPARVARWWPVVRPGVEIHAGDPWQAAMDWGASALPQVRFHRFPELPPTALEDGLFDFVYGISILTHLRLDAQRAWLAELRRLIRPGGLLALSLHGRSALSRLSDAERACWERGEMVERAQARHGSRLYLTYHPPESVRDDLARDWEIVLHEPDAELASRGQDLWLLRRM